LVETRATAPFVALRSVGDHGIYDPDMGC
jgi:hypothetical protein